MNENVDSNILHRKIFLQVQRLLKKINSYVDSLKTCENRFLENLNLDIRVHLKQHNLNKQNKGTHNKSTFNKMIAIMIFFDDMSDDRIIERDILIQSIHDDLISIFFWHFCYMSLRYSLIYFYDEQSWNKLISFRDHDINNNFLVKRSESDQMKRHDMKFRLRKNEKPKNVNFSSFECEDRKSEEAKRCEREWRRRIW